MPSKDNDGTVLAKRLMSTLIIVAFIGVVVSIFLYLGEIKENGVDGLCINTQCYGYFEKRFSPSIDVLKGTIKLLVAFSTVGGIYIAIKSYVSSSNASAISNHIGNLKIFKEFINNELYKHERVNVKSINIIHWYNKLFPESKNGGLIVSEEYKCLINKVNKVIADSNKVFSTSEKPDFSYVQHQMKMIEALSAIGLKLQRLPRNEFYQAEKEVLELIEVINIEFCLLPYDSYSFRKRLYI